MPTFITDQVLRAAVTAANAMRAEPLPDHWDALLPTANDRAYRRLKAKLLGRGFTPAQFLAWDDGADWNLRVAVVMAFAEAARSDEDRGAAYRDELRELWEEFATAEVVIGGEAVYPSGSGGRISTGDSDTSGDRFALDTPDGGGAFSTDDGGTRL